MSLSDAQAQELELLRAELADTRAKLRRLKGVRLTNIRVSDKGAVSFYGLSKYPVTLYADQWETLLSHADSILEFIEENRNRLAHK